MKSKEEIIKEMQLVVEQMKIDDLEERPELAEEFFDCQCCGKYKSLAGSIKYDEYRLCNDCVLLAEIGFALKKIDSVKDLIKVMEENRLEEMCKFINQDKKSLEN